jgi:hypothetical protein
MLSFLRHTLPKSEVRHIELAFGAEDEIQIIFRGKKAQRRFHRYDLLKEDVQADIVASLLDVFKPRKPRPKASRRFVKQGSKPGALV